MATARQPKRATIDDLSKTPEKAELVNRVLELMPPAGGQPGYAADEIYANLRAYACRTGQGQAVGENKGFLVTLPQRESFSPDAAY